MEGGGSHGGSVSILRSRVWFPLQTRGMPETLGYHWQGDVWCWGRGAGAAPWDRRAWPRTCQAAGPILLYPDDSRDQMC